MMGEEKANAINYARQAEDGGNPSTDIIGTWPAEGMGVSPFTVN